MSSIFDLFYQQYFLKKITLFSLFRNTETLFFPLKNQKVLVVRTMGSRLLRLLDMSARLAKLVWSVKNGSHQNSARSQTYKEIV